MKQEIGLLVVFLLIFLYDTFSTPKGSRHVPALSIVLMGILTIAGFCPHASATSEAFSGMYATSPVMGAIKNILNVGVLIIFIQAVKWANSEFVAIRRGEFYELILLTLFGMYLMISSRHFLMFVIGLETASLPLCALVAFDKNRYESHEAAIKYVLTAVFS
ncbi:MAG: NADH-quinone oxidoreductase subunit N, partial [Duncaniella sp.]|nr:NADH-quinone oxidoreductase subunit N [Duncaniella sp.]